MDAKAAVLLQEGAKRLAGGPLRDALLARVKDEVALLPVVPRLVIVQVGSDPASTVYVGVKTKAAQAVGIEADVVRVPADAGEGHLRHILHGLAAAGDVTAVILQLPLPAGYDAWGCVEMIPPHKDCDGLTAANAAKRAAGDAEAILPATPLGILRLLAHAGVDVAGKRVAVLGRSRVVGGPLRTMLRARGATVLEIDRDTPQPAALCRTADVVCSAIGVAHLLDEAWMKPGAVVVDVGITRGADGKLKGDVNPVRVEPVAALLTPVPGGVGPLTVASLLTNVVDCARLQAGMGKKDWEGDLPTL